MPKYTLFDLNTTVKNMDGEAMRTAGNKENTLIDLTVRLAFRRALNGQFEDESPSSNPMNPRDNKNVLSFEDRQKRYELSKRIWFAEMDVELTTEETAELKKCVNKTFIGEAAGFLNDIIEKKPVLNVKEPVNSPMPNPTSDPLKAD